MSNDEPRERTPVWVDGLVIDLEDPTIAASDPAFLSGHGIFEAVEVRDGRPLALERHLERLDHSGRIARITPPRRDRVHAAISELWAELRSVRPEIAPHAVARLTVSGGGRFVVSWRPWPDRGSPATVVTSPFRRNERSAVSGAKTTSYAEAIVAAEEARTRGAEEAILLNTRDELCEGTTSNVFVVIDDELVTPPPDSGLLRGVTRDLLLEAGVGWERAIHAGELARVTEAFLTSTSRRVHPIARWDDRDLMVDGPSTTAARSAWSSIVADLVAR